MFTGNISKLYKIQGTNIINANTIGNRIVQQNDINWSKRILGKEALAQIKVKIIIELFKPKLKPYINPSNVGVLIISSIKVSRIKIQSIINNSQIIKSK